jgi:formylglycine-generating enzyme required for sulfatase activity
MQVPISIRTMEYGCQDSFCLAIPVDGVATPKAPAGGFVELLQWIKLHSALLLTLWLPAQVQEAWKAPAMVLVEKGDFLMGSTQGNPIDQPVHPVKISKNFYIATYLTTFEEHDRYCSEVGRTRSSDKGMGRGKKKPVCSISWYDAVAYCNWLSAQEGLEPAYSGNGRAIVCDFAATGYRLPTEAEWEYAARGGKAGDGSRFAGSDDPGETSWYGGNSGDTTHPVGEKKPNALGLFDMCGNIFQWCWDWFSRDYYARSPMEDPRGDASPGGESIWRLEVEKARRGGSWRESSPAVTVWHRSQDWASYAGDNGFRVVRTAP